MMKSWRLKRDQQKQIRSWKTNTRPDLVWDAEAHGLCVRVYGDGSNLFLFVYRENRGREIPPVENVIRYITEHLQTPATP